MDSSPLATFDLVFLLLVILLLLLALSVAILAQVTCQLGREPPVHALPPRLHAMVCAGAD